jgi:hypothetical protein
MGAVIGVAHESEPSLGVAESSRAGLGQLDAGWLAEGQIRGIQPRRGPKSQAF